MQRKIKAIWTHLQARLTPSEAEARLPFEQSLWEPPGHIIRDMIRPSRKGAAKTLTMSLSITGPPALLHTGAGQHCPSNITYAHPSHLQHGNIGLALMKKSIHLPTSLWF